MKRFFRVHFRLIALVCLGWMASGAAAAEPARRLQLVASFFPVYCFVVNVAGNSAVVSCLLSGAGSPHDYSFTPKDRKQIASADLIFVNGLGLEDGLIKAIRRSEDKTPATMVELAAGLEPWLIGENIEEHHGEKESSHSHSRYNPHIWLDPQLVTHSVSNIISALVQADPANAAHYRQNGANYIARLMKLDAEIATALKPFLGSPVVTYHRAFPYFLRRYGLILAGVIEEVPEVSPSLKHMGRIRSVIREQQVRVLFLDPMQSIKLRSQLELDLQIPVKILNPLESGPLLPSAYETGMRENLAVLLKAFK